jgi:hypothetical protein
MPDNLRAEVFKLGHYSSHFTQLLDARRHGRWPVLAVRANLVSMPAGVSAVPRRCVPETGTSFTRCRRNELLTTNTDEKAIAPAAMIGLSCQPVSG